MINTLRYSAATLKKSNRKKKNPQITEAITGIRMSILSMRAGAGSRMSMPLLK